MWEYAELNVRDLNIQETDSFEYGTSQGTVKISVNFHFLSGIDIFLKCKISNRDLASFHVAFLLYLVREGVWEGA